MVQESLDADKGTTKTAPLLPPAADDDDKKGQKPIVYRGMTMDEAMKWSMEEYKEFLKVNDDDGLSWTNKTAQWIAYERSLESARPADERLFNDPLAKYLAGAYGQRLSEAMAPGMKLGIFDPTDDIGLGFEGHIKYTAARTQLISVKMMDWIDSTYGDRQVTNLGAGFDSRVFWDESLRDVKTYTEVDTEAVNTTKQKIIDEIKDNGGEGILSEAICERKVVSLDFSKESIKDLNHHDYDSSLPTCWILEGLIMYLTAEENDKLLDELNGLSVKGSYLILNYVSRNNDTDVITKRLEERGWSKTEQLRFGDEGFNFGRYPEGKPACEALGFIFFMKNE